MHGVTLYFEVFDSDYVKNSVKWTVSQLIDWLIESDIHLILVMFMKEVSVSLNRGILYDAL